MELKAREVLDDCNVALQMLEDEIDLQKWRIIWASALALIRTVGHVLHKVDREHLKNKKVTEKLYKDWTSDSEEHLIFREFIELERNNLLKEYKLNYSPLEKVSILSQVTLKPINGGEEKTLNEVFDIDENIYRPIMEGPWEGIDARDVLQAAIKWWDYQLNKIEEAQR